MNAANFYYHAPAKVNFSLRIGKKRQNNLHQVQSLMRKIKMFDKVSFKLTYGNYKILATSGKILKDIIPEHELALLSDEGNIVIEAAKLYFERLNITDRGVNVYWKRIYPLRADWVAGQATPQVCCLS